MLIRFVVTEPPDGQARRTEAARERHSTCWASRATRRYLFHGPIVMLTGSAILRWNLVGDWRLTWVILTGVGIGSGIAPGPFRRAADHGLAGRILEATEAIATGPGAWRGSRRSWGSSSEAAQPGGDHR